MQVVRLALTAKKGNVEIFATHNPWLKKGTIEIGLYPPDVPRIPINIHALHYGTGAFEGIRFYNTRNGSAIFRLDEHVARLERSFSRLLPEGMRFPYSPRMLRQSIVEAVRRSGLKQGYIRPLVFWGAGPLGVGAQGSSINFHVQTMPWGKYLEAKKITAFVTSEPRKTAYPGQKISGAYHAGTVAHFQATSHGSVEALLLNSKGKAAEGSGENMFVVKNGVLFTPPVREGEVLPGITREAILDIARKSGLKVNQKELSLEEVAAADELFYTGTAAEVTPIHELHLRMKGGRIFVKDEARRGDPFLISRREQERIAGRVGRRMPKNGLFKIRIGDGKTGRISEEIRRRFELAVKGEDPSRQDWLTYVSPSQAPLRFSEWERRGWFMKGRTLKVLHPESPEARQRAREFLEGISRISVSLRGKRPARRLPFNLAYRYKLGALDPMERTRIVQSRHFDREEERLDSRKRLMERRKRRGA